MSLEASRQQSADIDREIPASFVHEDELCVAIKDVNPQAPLHVLIVPRRHIASLNDLSAEDDALVGAMIRRAAALAREHGLPRHHVAGVPAQRAGRW